MIYCLKGLGSDSKYDNIDKPFRIVEANYSLRGILGNTCRGHSSLEKLRRECKTWKNYHHNDSKSGEIICRSNFIIKLTNEVIIFPMDEDFNKVSHKLLKHTLKGELGKKIQGIHLLSSINKNIKNYTIVKGPAQNGVWIADIEYYSPERDKTYFKENSTMFPIDWSPTQFMFEIYHAYQNKKQCIHDESIFHSFTSTGIRTDFVIKENEIRTVYPIFEE